MSEQIDQIPSGGSGRRVRGPRFKPLRRAVRLPVWGDLGIRLGLALLLIMLVVMIHWWDREGLVDNLDGVRRHRADQRPGASGRSGHRDTRSICRTLHLRRHGV